MDLLSAILHQVQVNNSAITTLNQEVHANNSAITTLSKVTNATITQLRGFADAAVQIFRENLHNAINGFQNNFTSAFRKIENSVVADKEDLNGKVAVFNLLTNRLYQLGNFVQNDRSNLSAVETTLETVEDKVQAV